MHLHARTIGVTIAFALVATSLFSYHAGESQGFFAGKNAPQYLGGAEMPPGDLSPTHTSRDLYGRAWMISYRPDEMTRAQCAATAKGYTALFVFEDDGTLRGTCFATWPNAEIIRTPGAWANK